MQKNARRSNGAGDGAGGRRAMSGARGANRSRVGLAALALLLACDGSAEAPKPEAVSTAAPDPTKAEAPAEEAKKPSTPARCHRRAPIPPLEHTCDIWEARRVLTPGNHLADE